MQQTSHHPIPSKAKDRRGVFRLLGGAELFALIALLWLGLLLGVSFLATPVKFQAPSLDLTAALDVGRVTFALFSKVEWLLWAALAAATVFSSSARLLRMAGALILLLLLTTQTLWLLPVLDERAGQIVAGATVSASKHHLFYIAADAVKALVLLGVSVSTMMRLATNLEDVRCE